MKVRICGCPYDGCHFKAMLPHQIFLFLKFFSTGFCIEKISRSLHHLFHTISYLHFSYNYFLNINNRVWYTKSLFFLELLVLVYLLSHKKLLNLSNFLSLCCTQDKFYFLLLFHKLHICDYITVPFKPNKDYKLAQC